MRAIVGLTERRSNVSVFTLMKTEHAATLRHLLNHKRQASLATVEDGQPYASMVAFVAEPEWDGFLMLLSGLSPHTRHLLAHPRASLMVCEAEQSDTEDVQTLPRVSLQGRVERVGRDDPEWSAVAARYLHKLPNAELFLQLGDFAFFRLVPESGRLVAGFAQTVNLSPEVLRSAVAS